MKEYRKLVLERIMEELRSAREAFPTFNSRHEGIAVIREEYLELEQAIFLEMADSFVYEEAIQLAAMAIRFIEDLWGPVAR